MNNSPPKTTDLPTREPSSPETVGLPTTSLPGNAAADLPQRIGDFTIVRILGEGGMGTVYLAEDVRLGRKAAIKTMKLALAARPENRLRFAREAQAAAAVEHDNIVPIWQVGEAADGSPFIAMPYLQGEMLEERLRREPIQPLAVILKVAREVADGLSAASFRGLIHRDIKPGNVWIEGDPESKDVARQVRRCKILDFGLARFEESDGVQVTASGTILGTPAYMAPEQAKGEKLDQRADLFSLGVMLYRMSTGKLPFTGPNTMAVLTALALVTPPSARTFNPNLPQALSDLIDRLLSKNPAGRPQSAGDVAAATRQIVKDLQAKKSVPSGPSTIQARAAPALATQAIKIAVPAKSQPASTPTRWAKLWRGRTPLLVAAGMLVLAPLVLWLAFVMLRVETANGTLIVEMNDAETEARIINGKLILSGPDGQVRYTLTPSERDKTIEAGSYKIRVEGADGLALDTSEFTLRKGDKVTVRVTAAHEAPAKNLDADRQAAEWLLSIGGMVKVNEQERLITAAADLPAQAFRLTWVSLYQNKQATDAGLAHFTDCKNLTSLNLGYTQVGDAGMAYFKDNKDLAVLNLESTKVSDLGLANFKDCKNLTALYLGQTQASDAGLASFKDCKNLTDLDLQKTSVTAAKIEEWKKALPGCKIEWEADVVEPTVRGDPDREAAQWVLSIGGIIDLNESRRIGGAADLPPEAFRVTMVWLHENTKVSDAGLAHFGGCKNVKALWLEKTQTSDAGAAYFKDCKDLVSINLGGTKVSDAGLAYFKDCKNLLGLHLWNTQVGDAGIANFQNCKNLMLLDLSGTKVSDAGLAYFKDCKNLTKLWLNNGGVTDAGLASFKDCKNLTTLVLNDTSVSDAGLAYFEDCKNLTQLSLQKTKVAAAMIEKLKKALPRCKIEWDGAVIEPRTGSKADREAAEWVLSIGGAVHVNGEDREIKAAADLPPDLFRLTQVWLFKNKQVTDAGLLAHFNDCKNLTHLCLADTLVSNAGLIPFKDCMNLSYIDLWNTQVGDAGLANFKDCKNFTTLWLQKTQVSDAGLAYFKGCKNLTRLDLSLTQVGDAGMINFKGCENLTDLNLSGTHVSEAGLARFKDCKKLTGLYLNSTRTSDPGLSYFKDCKNLTHLDVGATSVGDLGLAHFKDCKNLTTLNLWSTRVSDAGLANFKDCKNLTLLELGETKLSDVGLANFKDCKNLTFLNLAPTKATNGGLTNFKDCKNLAFLNLAGTQVSDAGLVNFEGCTNLTTLNLRKTKVSAAKIVELKKALPKCKIEWDGGVIEPTAK